MTTRTLIFPIIVAAVGLALTACNRDEVIIEDLTDGDGTPAPASSLTVYDYTPAPGQFINEGVTLSTPADAAAWAQQRLAEGRFVSLGGFGGYIVVGFGCEVTRFAISGNAIPTSNEPGVVWVMADANGNGLPDDEWVELLGSETEGVIRDYSVTYHRPADGEPVLWTDSEGAMGQIDYLPAYHSQSTYYPAWIDAEQYTLTGTRLEARTREVSPGQWDSPAYEFGYADNRGSDLMADGVSVSFTAPGPVHFIKVQTALNATSGWLGELSTEVTGFKRL